MHGFDIERAKEVAKMLEGLHDFRSFMKKSKEEKTVNFVLVFISDRLVFNNNNDNRTVLFFSSIPNSVLEKWIASKLHLAEQFPRLLTETEQMQNTHFGTSISNRELFFIGR